MQTKAIRQYKQNKGVNKGYYKIINLDKGVNKGYKII